MHRTQHLARWVSTHHGQRRILKRPIPVVEYMRKAVETGIWRNEPENNRPRHPRRPVPSRDEDPNDYPLEYEILSMNPMPVEPPRYVLWNESVLSVSVTNVVC